MLPLWGTVVCSLPQLVKFGCSFREQIHCCWTPVPCQPLCRHLHTSLLLVLSILLQAWPSFFSPSHFVKGTQSSGWSGEHSVVLAAVMGQEGSCDPHYAIQVNCRSCRECWGKNPVSAHVDRTAGVRAVQLSSPRGGSLQVNPVTQWVDNRGKESRLDNTAELLRAAPLKSALSSGHFSYVNQHIPWF